MKYWHKVVIIILAFICVVGLSSCDLFSTNGNNTDEVRVTKPAFKVALDNYSGLDAKKSDFQGKIVFSIYGKEKADGTRTAYSTGQRIDLTRIQNGGKIFVDGKLYNEEVSDNMKQLLSIIKSDISFFGFSGKVNSAIQTGLNYLDGTNSANFLLGYDSVSTSYNFKGQLKNGDKPQKVYYATNNQYIMNQFLKNNINTSIKFNDYLMFSTFVDFSDNGGWISKDDASAFFDNKNNLGDYQMSASNQKIYDYVIGLIDEFIESLNIEHYKDNIVKYTECVDIIKGWVSVGESNITASVNKNNLPVKMQTSIRINIDVKIDELEQVLNKIIDDEEKIDDIIKTIKMVRTLSSNSSSLNMSIDISLNETFSYDKESTSLATVDKDMFIDAKENKAGRVSYIVDEKASDEDTTVDTNNADNTDS